MAAPGPAILVHLELTVQSTKVPREPNLIAEKWRRKIFSVLRADWSALRASMHCLRQRLQYIGPPLSQILYPPLRECLLIYKVQVTFSHSARSVTYQQSIARYRLFNCVRFSLCCSPLASNSATTPRLYLLQLLPQGDCVCFSYYSPIVFASGAAPQLRLFWLLLPIVSTSIAAPCFRPLQPLLPACHSGRTQPLPNVLASKVVVKYEGFLSLVWSCPPSIPLL